GWEPLYLTLRDGGGLAAAVAAFVKTHSFGEFVFDFAWARAYEGVGRRYYPKLTVGAPFTPATGPRLLVRADLDRDELDEGLLERIYALHRDTFVRHGHEPYLTRAFFSEAARVMPESLMVKLAVHGRAVVAAAIFFWCEEALFGRYWGADADYHSLH